MCVRVIGWEAGEEEVRSSSRLSSVSIAEIFEEGGVKPGGSVPKPKSEKIGECGWDGELVMDCGKY